MPSIFAVVNPKGGSGKTTLAIILAGEFARHGYAVTIIDADPQGSSLQWHATSTARGFAPVGVSIARAADTAGLARAIADCEDRDVIIIDTPGYYGNVLVQSALQADLVVLPCKVHTFDASQIVRTLTNLSRHAEAAGLPMSRYRVLFNEYDSFDRNTRPLRDVLAYLDGEGISVCANALYRRVTYRTMTGGHGTLYQMDDRDEAVQRAKSNADQVVRELLAAAQRGVNETAA